MGDVYFYHLTQTPLEATLPMLLDKARGAGWRVIVRARTSKRLDWLDQKLWLEPDDGFLPHGMSGGPFDADQPILLTTGMERPNQAQCVMAVEGAEILATELKDLNRACVLFDGTDPAAVENARTQWRSLTAAGCQAQYWSQESGRWEKKAQSAGSASR